MKQSQLAQSELWSAVYSLQEDNAIRANNAETEVGLLRAMVARLEEEKAGHYLVNLAKANGFKSVTDAITQAVNLRAQLASSETHGAEDRAILDWLEKNVTRLNVRNYGCLINPDYCDDYSFRAAVLAAMKGDEVTTEQLATLTPKEKQVKIAEACGWKREQRESGEWYIQPDGALEWTHPPGYLNSLDAMHEAEKTLTPEQKDAYFERLSQTQWTWRGMHASASQRADAFLLTVA